MMFQVAAGDRVSIDLTVNGRHVAILVEPGTLLVDAIREDVGLTGTHVGCRTGDCGACTIVLEGLTVKSCLVLAVAARGGSILTVEALGTAAELHPVQEAFDEAFAYQCGFCLPGMLLCAREAIEAGATSDDALRQAIDGNLCRCTGYVNILAALRALAARHGVSPTPGRDTGAG